MNRSQIRGTYNLSCRPLAQSAASGSEIFQGRISCEKTMSIQFGNGWIITFSKRFDNEPHRQH